MDITNPKTRSSLTVVTAGSNYLDIDAYACCVAMRELLTLQGINSIAYSSAVCNYSVCRSLTEEGQVLKTLPADYKAENADYIIVDVSDPDYISGAVPLEQVAQVYDHHVGFESYWEERIGSGANIEFIGAAATLIYRLWKKAGLQEKMTRQAARLLIAAILDNTLYLTSANTREEDRQAFDELCLHAGVDSEWCAYYFSEVQKTVEADLKNALFNDLKTVKQGDVLPPRIAQLCVWDTDSFLKRLPEIRQWFEKFSDGWMLNLIDIKNRCSFFVCDESNYQKKIESIFQVRFEDGIAISRVPYLRKEIIKKCISNSRKGE